MRRSTTVAESLRMQRKTHDGAHTAYLWKIMLAITQLHALPAQLFDLEREASTQGFRFLRRLIEEWRSGSNRFDKPGERLLVAEDDGNIVGIGGLNVDPYATARDTARLRRVYVANDHRRRGIGEALVGALLEEASSRFRVVRLSTDTDVAAAFYERLGFSAVADETATHEKMLW
ncbi:MULTISPECIES: GNAT family N-acetyltransferase [Paraburkholderia]|uniref:GNAT family N-acetyltransferase n=1 Tax=Paraburkholderia TaxID=1822464 RepID=UPI00224CD139|nr:MULTISPECIES: GNAT family N-acetyltransferase [Paraburkholderia]MCX4164355.1 GNAT family N-acetyltransferase [Paraburkholderia megapolitana]MDN7159848.1 GNAT family N-acetyltransferase [Paraburkholderia sp. CHISQ3]MDQ6496895.1 GNAT family N-acetyltransferase [Paraburkholderia megapolitana]